jgi:hypothetical protein
LTATFALCKFPDITRKNKDKGIQIVEIDQSKLSKLSKPRQRAWMDHTKIFETIEALTHITFAGLWEWGEK